MEKHTVKSFDEELDALNSWIRAMGTSCEWQLSKALKALETNDKRLAEEVIKEDENLNALYQKVEENGVKFIAKRSPLASDLRFILTAMRTGSEFERIGDYAANIAKRVIEMNGAKTDFEAPVTLIQDMGKICRKMISGIAAAFVEQNTQAAIEVWHRDDEVDRKFARLMTDLRNRMQQDTEIINDCTQLIFVGRCLERIGDHITNISEGIYYIETGETYIGALES